MAWIVLIVAGIFEAVWATALGKSDGFSRLTPTIVFVIAILISMSGLAYAMRELAVGTSYAIWVGIGATLTVTYAMAFDGEPVSPVKIMLLLGIVGCLIGLKVIS